MCSSKCVKKSFILFLYAKFDYKTTCKISYLLEFFFWRLVWSVLCRNKPVQEMVFTFWSSNVQNGRTSPLSDKQSKISIKSSDYIDIFFFNITAFFFFAWIRFTEQLFILHDIRWRRTTGWHICQSSSKYTLFSSTQCSCLKTFNFKIYLHTMIFKFLYNVICSIT